MKIESAIRKMECMRELNNTPSIDIAYSMAIDALKMQLINNNEQSKFNKNKYKSSYYNEKKHRYSRSRLINENHISMRVELENMNDSEIIIEEFRKMLRRCQNLLNKKLSYEELILNQHHCNNQVANLRM